MTAINMCSNFGGFRLSPPLMDGGGYPSKHPQNITLFYLTYAGGILLSECCLLFGAFKKILCKIILPIGTFS